MLSWTCQQSAIADASDGAQASTAYVRKLRHQAPVSVHPFGQDLLDVLDLRRRSGYKHPYVKAVIDRDDFTIVVLQNEEQARLSGRVRYCEADSTFGVVAPGAAKEGVAPEVVSSSGKQAFDWNHFSVVHVGLAPSRGRVQC